MGFDLDGLTGSPPYMLEARGNFGFSPAAGETAIFWSIGGPFRKGWPKWSVKPLGTFSDDVIRMPWGAAMKKNEDFIPEWAGQYYPVKLEIGVGYQGISFEQEGGSIVDGGDTVKNTTTGMIAGLAYAARVAFFGERDMLRLTGYYLSSSNAKTGGKFADTLSGFGGEMDATTKGSLVEGKLDWYHRLDERVQAGSWISGYGLSLIGRKIHLDQGQTTQARSGVKIECRLTAGRCTLTSACPGEIRIRNNMPRKLRNRTCS